MACETCDNMKSRKILYEDEKLIAYLHEKPATSGHIVVAPKEHWPILESVPDDIVEHVFVVTNKLSAMTFEVLGALGTNIVVHNGIPAGQKEPHFQVHIVPRKENDGLDLQWQPKQASEEDLAAIIEKFNEKPPEPQPEAPEPDDGPEDYLLDTLTRIP